MTTKSKKHFDVIVLGGGAAGLFCAIEAGKRGRTALVIDHARAPAEKIRISGGGRCNFTNIHCGPNNFLSQNAHFCKSALSNYTQHDFIALVKKHNIAFHEKTLGQLFCDKSAKDIIEMLLIEMASANAELWLETSIKSVAKADGGFAVDTSAGALSCGSLVVATGGKSIPKMGATGLGYQIAEQFGLAIVEPRPALVPFTYSSDMAESWRELAGVAVDVTASIGKIAFREAMLITHRGFSGPAILQISSYWREGGAVQVDLLNGASFGKIVDDARNHSADKQTLKGALTDLFPKRLAQHLCVEMSLDDKRLAEISQKGIHAIGERLQNFSFLPGGTEGYRTAEVTLGGVNTDGLSQKTMEAKAVPDLFFIGEVVDVTGHMGGHNFQWAWSSGYAAGQAV